MPIHKNFFLLFTFIIVWTTIFMAFPFSIPQAYNIPYKAVLAGVVPILIILILLKWKSLKIDNTLAGIFLVQVCTAILWLILHQDTGYTNMLLQIVAAFIVYVAFNSVLGGEYFSKAVVRFILWSGILGVVCFLLCLVINLPYLNEFANPDGRSGYNFIIGFTNSLYDIGSAKIIRPSGFFDEPGALALYTFVAILINDMMFGNKRVRILLFIAGSFTLSVAFYAVMIIYFLLYMKLKDLKRVVIGTFFISILLFAGYMKLDEERQSIIRGYTFGRIESIFNAGSSSSSDYYKGDNRSELVEIAAESIKDSPLIGAGLSYPIKPGSKFYGTFMGANFLGIFGIHGIIGGIIFSLHVIYYAWVCLKRRSLRFDIPQKSLLIYFLLILQRPDYVGGIFTSVVVYLLIISTKYYYSKQTINA